MSAVTIPIRMLSIKDSRWVESSFRAAMEYPITEAKRINGRTSKDSTATLYRKWKMLLASQHRGSGGPYPDTVRSLLRAHKVKASTADRIATLLALHLVIFLKSWNTPRNEDQPNGKDRLATGFQFAYEQLFGPEAIFQNMNASCGPIGMAMVSHALALGREGFPHQVGPFQPSMFQKAQHKRTFVSWMENRRMPRPGWYCTHGVLNRPGLAKAISARIDLPDAKVGKYSKSYPWSGHVSFGDMLVYKWARTVSCCIRAISEDGRHSHQRATDILKNVLIILPMEM